MSFTHPLLALSIIEVSSKSLPTSRVVVGWREVLVKETLHIQHPEDLCFNGGVELELPDW